MHQHQHKHEHAPSPRHAGPRVAAPGPGSPVEQKLLHLQRTAGNAALLADLHTPPATGVQRQSAPVAEERYTLTIRGQLYPALEATDALARLARHHQYLASMLDIGVENHQFLKANREEHSIVGWMSDTLGGVELPPLSIWQVPRRTLVKAQAALDAGRVAEASRLLDLADVETRSCDRRVDNYREGTISGAEVGQDIALGVAVTCLVVAAAAGGAALAGVGAGIGGGGAGAGTVAAGTAGATETVAGAGALTTAGEGAAGLGTATATGETAVGVGTATAAGETAAGVGTATATGETAVGVGTATAAGETAAGVGTATAAGETAAGATVAGEVAAGLAPEVLAAADGAAVGAETTAASGAVNAAGKLMQVLRAIEGSWAGAGPRTAMDALSVIQTAVRSVGLETGVLSYLAGGGMMLKNFGGITTYLLINGQILVMRGAQVLLNLKP